jgi:dTMP kinase
MFLFSASRAQLVHQIILPALRRGEIVVCDRYHDSTTAYQGYGRGLDLDTVRQINAVATAGTDPDLTILVDISVDEIGRRQSAAGMGLDRMENAGTDFYERVRNGYLSIAKEHPHRCVVIDGMRPMQDIASDVAQAIEKCRQRQRREET